MIHRFPLLYILGFSLFSLSVVAKDRPDVLFIAIDDMNDWTTLFDPDNPIQTPNLERLAARGAFFTQAYCASPGCNPSRTAIMTGLRPTRSGVYSNKNPWREALPDAVTLPQYFAEHGYETKGGGKILHHGGTGKEPADNPSFQEFFERIPFTTPKIRDGAFGCFDWGSIPAEDMCDTPMIEWAEGVMELKQNKPVFLAAGIFMPHLPHFAPHETFEKYPFDSVVMPPMPEGDLEDVPARGVEMARKEWGWKGYLFDDPPPEDDPASLKSLVRAYQASSTYADDMVGRLIDQLDATGRTNNTIIVLWSDHGYHLGDKMSTVKFTLWEKANHVPFIIVAPGMVQPGTRIDQPVGLVNIYKTLADLADLPVPKDLDGESLVPLLKNPDADWERPALMTEGRGNHAVRSEDWRYIRYDDGTEELYEVATDDPWNHTNLLAGEDAAQYAEVVADHQKWLPETEAETGPVYKRPASKKKAASVEEADAADIETRAAVAAEVKPVSPGTLKHYTHRFQDALVRDFHRPSWHLGSLSGNWWDVNGLTFREGRYHAMFMRNRYAADGKRLPGNWGHASSRDLFTWRFHPDSITQEMIEDPKEFPIFSGDSIENAPRPTLIFHVPHRGTQIAVAQDDEMREWKLVPQDPVLKINDARFPEVIVFDPTAWYDEDEGVYYALIGARNKRPGYNVGDSTSLLRSQDLKAWEYLGPLYKSSRDMTQVFEDTACADFFPMDDKWVLVNHVHNPWTHVRYYVGEFDGREFKPETVGRLTYLNDQMAAPETVLDNQGRRIFFGQVRSSSKEGLWGTNFSQPIELTLGDDKDLRFRPVAELASLRYGSASIEAIEMDSETKPLPEATGRSLELRANFTGIDAEAVGFRLAASPDGEEFTDVVYRPEAGVIEFDFAKSDLLNRTKYYRYHPRMVKPGFFKPEDNPPVTKQQVPFQLGRGEDLDLHVFFDGCIIEVIANAKTFAVQTTYPSRRDSVLTHLIVKGGSATASHVETHHLDATMAY